MPLCPQVSGGGVGGQGLRAWHGTGWPVLHRNTWALAERKGCQPGPAGRLGCADVFSPPLM